MARLLRHRQTKGAETDKPALPPPRHIPTSPKTAVPVTLRQALPLGAKQTGSAKKPTFRALFRRNFKLSQLPGRRHGTPRPAQGANARLFTRVRVHPTGAARAPWVAPARLEPVLSDNPAPREMWITLWRRCVEFVK